MSVHLADSGIASPVGLFVGLTVLDVIQLVTEPPGPDDKITALDQVVAAGGPATNAAVTFAALGGHALLAAPVGEGPLAALVRADLAACGVELIDCTGPGAASSGLTPPPRSTPSPHPGRVPPSVTVSGRVGAASQGPALALAAGNSTLPVTGSAASGGLSVSSCTVSARTGQRSVVSTNARLPVDEAPLRNLAAQVAAGQRPAPDVVLIDGHNPVLAGLALDLAEATGALTLMDAGSWKDDAADLLPRLDVVAPSARFYPPGVLPLPDDVAAWLLDCGVPAVVLTRGEEDALWWQAVQPVASRPALAPPAPAAAPVPAVPRTGSPADPPVFTAPSAGANAPGPSPAGPTSGGATATQARRGAVEPPETTVIDTLGAGDAFHGALAHALGCREDLPAAVATACQVAARSTASFGTRAWLGDLSG